MDALITLQGEDIDNVERTADDVRKDMERGYVAPHTPPLPASDGPAHAQRRADGEGRRARARRAPQALVLLLPLPPHPRDRRHRRRRHGGQEGACSLPPSIHPRNLTSYLRRTEPTRQIQIAPQGRTALSYLLRFYLYTSRNTVRRSGIYTT